MLELHDGRNFTFFELSELTLTQRREIYRKARADSAHRMGREEFDATCAELVAAGYGSKIAAVDRSVSFTYAAQDLASYLDMSRRAADSFVERVLAGGW